MRVAAPLICDRRPLLFSSHLFTSLHIYFQVVRLEMSPLSELRVTVLSQDQTQGTSISCLR
jgi:hypothetical protein